MRFWVVLVFLTIAISVYIVVRRRADTCRVLRRIQSDDGVIEIVDAACKEGLPHTTDAHTIRMTETAYNSPRSPRTLIHERVHLDQRRRRDAWLEFYAREWGYTLLVRPPQDLTAAAADLRPNPDTADAPWAVWRERYVFFPMYGADRTLRNASVRVWDLQKTAFVDVPDAWRLEFGEVHQYEHPHEIAAEYITEGSHTPAAQKLFAWKH